MVHAILLSRAPASAVDDLQQEVFMTALRKISDLREPDAFAGWLAQIARRAAADHHRRSPGHEPLGNDLPSHAGSAQARVEAERVMAGIRGLPEDYGELLIMRLVEGMSGPEIAELLALSPGYVRVKLHRGLGMLREHLGIRKEPS
jgi:RNA polymerase sigma-70 factor (ECF subfamily)